MFHTLVTKQDFFLYNYIKIHYKTFYIKVKFHKSKAYQSENETSHQRNAEHSYLERESGFEVL